MGFATRFWDCCKPSCAWSGKGGNSPVKSCSGGDTVTSATTQSACSGGSSYACYDFSPFQVDAYTSYGFAAFNNATCGDCYELDFLGTSNSQGASDPGSKQLCGKKMIVMVVNTGGLQNNQFDIMIPGGGVGAFNACSTEWGTSNLGAQYGGIMSTCQMQSNNYATYSACTKTACQSLFSNSSEAELLAGCNWFTGWFGNADNPNMLYTKVACPSQLTKLAQ
jgi:hypothetical protein